MGKLKYIVSVYFSFFSLLSFPQGFNSDKVELANFLTRMYKMQPFEGVKVVSDYDGTYLLSVLTLNRGKYETESKMYRVAGVKAMSQASRFFNGSYVTTDLMIKTTEKSDESIETEMVERIKEQSAGYIQSLELLTNFSVNDKEEVFIYYKQIEKSE